MDLIGPAPRGASGGAFGQKEGPGGAMAEGDAVDDRKVDVQRQGATARCAAPCRRM